MPKRMKMRTLLLYTLSAVGCLNSDGFSSLFTLLHLHKLFNVSQRHREATTKMSNEAATSAAGGARRLQPRQVPVNSYKDVLPVLKETLRKLEHPFIRKLEEKTGLDREKLCYIVCSAVTFLLMCSPGNAFLCTLIGVAYPAYQSLMSIRTKTDDTQWLMYWCLFALFSLCDNSFAVALPLYALVKTIILLYLALPQTYGAHNIYVIYVDPMLDWAIVRITAAIALMSALMETLH